MGRTDQWGKERQITIGGCSRSVNGESDIEFPANEVFSGSGQPYVPTAGGAMTGDLKRNINDADYTVYSATTETTESGTSVNIKFGDVNANPVMLGLSQPIWNNGINVKKLLTEDDIYELERRISELESMARDYVSLISVDEYRKYRKLLPNTNKWWWRRI